MKENGISVKKNLFRDICFGLFLSLCFNAAFRNTESRYEDQLSAVSSRAANGWPSYMLPCTQGHPRELIKSLCPKGYLDSAILNGNIMYLTLTFLPLENWILIHRHAPCQIKRTLFSKEKRPFLLCCIH